MKELNDNSKTLIILVFGLLLAVLQVIAWQNGYNGTIRALFTGFFAAVIFYVTGYKIAKKQ